MHALMMRLSRAMAYAGGAVLAALIVLTCLSILGRAANSALHEIGTPWARGLIDAGIGAINGDFELVEAGMAFAIFAFIPLCQITAGHASVDVFANALGPRVNKVLRWLTDVIFAAVLILIAVQLGAGLMSKFRSGQTTFLLEFPIWWSYAGSLVGAVLAALVAIYLAAMRTAEVFTGRVLLPADMGAEH